MEVRGTTYKVMGSNPKSPGVILMQMDDEIEDPLKTTECVPEVSSGQTVFYTLNNHTNVVGIIVPRGVNKTVAAQAVRRRFGAGSALHFLGFPRDNEFVSVPPRPAGDLAAQASA